MRDGLARHIYQAGFNKFPDSYLKLRVHLPLVQHKMHKLLRGVVIMTLEEDPLAMCHIEWANSTSVFDHPLRKIELLAEGTKDILYIQA